MSKRDIISSTMYNSVVSLKPMVTNVRRRQKIKSINKN